MDEIITRAQETARLRDALLDLPEQERTVLSLYYFDELRLIDIARILEVSESRVSQIHSKRFSACAANSDDCAEISSHQPSAIGSLPADG